MENSKSCTRRKALTLMGGGLLGTTQLPKAWTRPVVNSIILPVHAQTTTPEIQSQPDETPVKPALPTHFRDVISFPAIASLDLPARNISDLLSLFVSDAQAGTGAVPAISADFSIDSPDSINFTAKCNILVFQSILTLTANGQVNGSPATLIIPACSNKPIGTLAVTTITAGGAPYSITLDNSFRGTNTQGVLPIGVGEPDTSNACTFDG